MNMNKIKGFLKNFFDYICKYKEIILLALPFLILDLTTRIFFPTSFVSFWYIVPNLFTILWCFLFLGIVFSFKSKIGRKIYVLILDIDDESKKVKVSIKDIYYLSHDDENKIKETRRGFLPLKEMLPIWIKEKMMEYENKEKGC